MSGLKLMLASLFALFSVLSLGFPLFVNAVPLSPRTELIAFGPNITEPHQGATWTQGSTQVIEWLTSNVPPDARNHKVDFVLGHWDNNSENLNLTFPLATDIPILQGRVTVQVRDDTPPRNNYFVVAIGVADDTSAIFSICAQ